KETTTMNYVLMIHAAESRAASRSKSEQEALMQAYGAFTKELFATGRAGDCAALEPTKTATTVQLRNGQRIVKDGPFAETREQLGGYYSFDAKDEDEAQAWAARIPSAKDGTIELRPVVDSGPPEAAAPGAKVDPKALKEYILLIYETEARWATMSEEEQRATFARYGEFTRGVREAGQLVAGEQLDTVMKAKSVSVTGQGRVVRDGPFAETREQLGGYYRVRARNLDEAIQLACRIPAAETGTIEIRPVADTSAYA
ncbi:MAG: hypothetical protein KF782_31365, partial [Labilithrix sp.]|nr:hypothetical protein [Labilithrix sp.]